MIKYITVGDFNFDGDNFQLPHECDEWIIGDIKAMEKFLKNGQKILKQVKEQGR